MKTITRLFYLSLFFFFGSAVKSFAQTSLPNPGFEQWDSSGNPPPFDWHQPSDWSSTNPVTEFNSAGITKSVGAHAGSFAVQIKSQNIFGTQRAGGLVCGHAKTQTFPDYTILPITGGEPVGSKTKKVRGYYKFSTITSGDSAYVIAINKKWNSGLNQPDTIGLGILKLPPASSYTLFELSIADWDSLVAPDSIVVAFFSSNPDTALEGGILLVDDVELDFSNAIQTVNDGSSSINIFPNPSSGVFNIRFNEKNNFVQMNIYSALGKLIFTQNISGQNAFQFDLKNFPEDMYWFELKNKKGELLRRKFLKMN